MNAKKSINTLLNQFSGKSDMPNYIESPASYKETYTAAEVERIKRAERLDELRDVVTLFLSPEFSAQQRTAYIKARVKELAEQAAIADGKGDEDDVV